jgi:ribosomal protein S18 acetylase RimI-like enzyme
MPVIGPYRAGSDRVDVYEVCRRTGASGADATGHYSDDDLLGDVYAGPYLAYAPDLAFVVRAASPESSSNRLRPPTGTPDRATRVGGYIIGVADTAAFVDWYRREWLPGFCERHPHSGRPTGANPAYSEAQLLADGRNPERMLIPHLADYPAHLHIDLLPELQGTGLGRRLIDTLRAALRDRGVPGVHLSMDPSNTSARAFYDRLGFRDLPSSRPGAPLLGISTDLAG